MIHVLLIFTLIAAVVEWVAVGKLWRRAEYFAKPAVMVFLLLWLILSGSLREHHLLWFTLGAFLSLLGDMFLLLNWDRLGFALGLFSFLLAHLSYIVGMGFPFASLGLHSLIISGLIITLALWVGTRILNRLRRRGLRRLIVPVFLYILTIGIILFCAINLPFRTDWNLPPAMLVALGASSFAVSDTFLVWNKFVSPFRYGRVLLMITYHLGQMAILMGAVWQFS